MKIDRVQTLLSLEARRPFPLEFLLPLFGKRNRLAARNLVDLLREPRVGSLVVLEELLKLLHLLCPHSIYRPTLLIRLLQRKAGLV
jgi:hypothetical protein